MAETVSELRVVIDVDTSGVERGLKSASSQVSSFGSSFKEGLAMGAGFSAFQAGLESIGAGFSSLKSSAIDFNQTIDAARASMSRFFDSNESLNNSIANLNTLAAKTPFAFEGLLTAQQRTIGAARSADELKQNMDAIAVVAANTGRVSTANMERISLALGQMQSKGHLAGGELLQLTEAGVNMGEILAKHFGVSTAAIQKMASEGKISAQEVFAALRENAADPKMREALDQLAKTWEGAWSTIGDVGKTAIAQTFRPLFDLLTEGAVAFADFLQTDNFKVWAEALRVGFEGAAGGIKAMLSDLAPLGEAIATAFGQASSGNFSGAFSTIGSGIQAALGSAVGAVRDFASQMFGGGVTLIEELAGGIMSGAQGVLQGAIDGVAQLIASFFIGNSPPPEGPLSKIGEGGANTATAWTDGFAGAMGKGVEQAATTAAGSILALKSASTGIASQIRDITDESQALDRTMRGLKGTIDDVKAGFTAQKQVMQDAADATKERYATAIQGVRDQIDTIKDSHAAAAREVQGQIDAIKDRYSNDIEAVKEVIGSIKDEYDAAETSVQRQIDLVKDRYGAAIDAVKDKITATKGVYDLLETSLARQIDAVKDKYGAAIDGVRTKIDSVKERYATQEASIQKQIDLVKDQYSTALDRVHGQIDAITTSQDRQLAPLQKQLDAMQSANKLLRERQDAERAIANAKTQQLQLDALGDPTLRAQLAGQLAGIDQQQQKLDLAQQLVEVTKKLSATDLTEADRASLKLKIDQLTIQKQLADMVDVTKLSEATRQQQLLDTSGKQLEVTRAIQDVTQKTLELPIEQQMTRIKDAADAALAPLQERLKSLEAGQKAALDPLQDKLKSVKEQGDTALAALQATLKGLEADQKAALDPLEDKLKSVKQQGDDALTKLQSTLKGLESDQKAALDPLQDHLKSLKDEERDLLVPLQLRLRDLEISQKAALDPLNRQLKDIKDNEKDLLVPLQDQLQGLTRESDTWSRTYSAGLKEIDRQQREVLAPLQAQLDLYQQQKDALTDRKQDLDAIKTRISEQIQLQQQAEAAAKAAKTAVQDVPRIPLTFDLDAKAKEAADAVKAKGAELATGLKDGFIGWITANPLVTAATITGMLFGAGQGAALGASLGSVVPVVGTVIGGVLGAGLGAAIGGIAAGQLASQLQAKIEEIVGGPLVAAIRAKFVALNAAFNEGGFGGVVTATLKILADAVPRITGLLAGWVTALVDWAGRVVPELLPKLQTIIDGVLGWIGTNAGPIGNKLAAWALALVGWVSGAGLDLLSKLATLGGQVLDWIGRNAITIAGKLAEWATAFVVWVGPKIPELLTALGGLLSRTVEWIGSNAGRLADALGRWALEFVEWVGPKIPPLLAELGKLLVSVTSWLLTDAIPATTLKIAEWAGAFVGWVLPRIPDLLINLGKFYLAVLNWFNQEAIPGIALGALELGKALIQGIWNGTQALLQGFLSFLGQTAEGFIRAIGVVLGDTQASERVLALGKALLNGISAGISAGIDGFKGWLKTNFTDQLPGWLREMLGIHSPSALMVPIGNALIDGIIAGMEEKVPLLKRVLDGIRGMVGPGGPPGGGGGPVPGALDDWLKSAISITNVGSDWLDGLRWLAMHESTGIPTAVNPTGVGPGGSGEHAAGLMQTIPSTFAAYRSKDLPNDIFNPIANAVASINYIKQRYGNIQNVINGWATRGGYAQGGILPENMTAIGRSGGLYNLHGGEGVFNQEQMAHMAPVGGGDTYIIDARGAVVYDGSKFEDMLVRSLERANARGRIVKVTR